MVKGLAMIASPLEKLLADGVSPTSCNTYLRGLKAYVRWLHAEGHLPEPFKITFLKTEQKLITTLTSGEIDRLLAVRPHKLRHTFGTNYIREGGSLELLRRCLGHASITTTARYLHLDIGDLKAVHNSSHPLRRKEVHARSSLKRSGPAAHAGATGPRHPIIPNRRMGGSPNRRVECLHTILPDQRHLDSVCLAPLGSSGTVSHCSSGSMAHA
jgi:hypothetical protein